MLKVFKNKFRGLPGPRASIAKAKSRPKSTADGETADSVLDVVKVSFKIEGLESNKIGDDTKAALWTALRDLVAAKLGVDKKNVAFTLSLSSMSVNAKVKATEAGIKVENVMQSVSEISSDEIFETVKNIPNIEKAATAGSLNGLSASAPVAKVVKMEEAKRGGSRGSASRDQGKGSSIKKLVFAAVGVFFLFTIGADNLLSSRSDGKNNMPKQAKLPIGLGYDGSANDLIRYALQDQSRSAIINVYSSDFNNIGPSLVTAKDIAPGEVVFQVPFQRRLYLGQHMLPRAFLSYASQIRLLPGPAGAQQRLVIVVLLERAKPTSGWHSFFNSLPKRIDNLVVFGEAQRKALGFGPFKHKFEALDQMIESTSKFVAAAKTLFPETPSDDEIAWAIAVVESRAEYVRQKNEWVLWPYSFLANHHYNKSKTLINAASSSSTGNPWKDMLGSSLGNTQWGSLLGGGQETSLRTQAARAPLRKGEQVFFHYGNFGNLRLLTQYGFTLPGNPVLLTPIELLKKAGPGIFRFGRKFAPCKDMQDKYEETLARSTTLSSGIPVLLIVCWRLSQFQNEAEVRTAIKSGMLGNGKEIGGRPEHWQNVPTVWLENDAKALEEISASCAEQQQRFETAISELEGLSDSISAQLHSALVDEMNGWGRCVKSLAGNAKEVRSFLNNEAGKVHPKKDEL